MVINIFAQDNLNIFDLIVALLPIAALIILAAIITEWGRRTGGINPYGGWK